MDSKKEDDILTNFDIHLENYLKELNSMLDRQEEARERSK